MRCLRAPPYTGANDDWLAPCLDELHSFLEAHPKTWTNWVDRARLKVVDTIVSWGTLMIASKRATAHFAKSQRDLISRVTIELAAMVYVLQRFFIWFPSANHAHTLSL